MKIFADNDVLLKIMNKRSLRNVLNIAYLTEINTKIHSVASSHFHKWAHNCIQLQFMANTCKRRRQANRKVEIGA